MKFHRLGGKSNQCTFLASAAHCVLGKKKLLCPFSNFSLCEGTIFLQLFPNVSIVTVGSKDSSLGYERVFLLSSRSLILGC